MENADIDQTSQGVPELLLSGRLGWAYNEEVQFATNGAVTLASASLCYHISDSCSRWYAPTSFNINDVLIPLQAYGLPSILLDLRPDVKKINDPGNFLTLCRDNGSLFRLPRASLYLSEFTAAKTYALRAPGNFVPRVIFLRDDEWPSCERSEGYCPQSSLDGSLAPACTTPEPSRHFSNTLRVFQCISTPYDGEFILRTLWFNSPRSYRNNFR
ncbi:hypothetical protein EDD85DRAFT_794144 [Armillaria nabsnona]|nr:hypothetical protein EDD85DRAFT_794144 [Armillaria nabsnona]